MQKRRVLLVTTAVLGIIGCIILAVLLSRRSRVSVRLGPILGVSTQPSLTREKYIVLCIGALPYGSITHFVAQGED